jgi:hypothetical protein
MTDDLTRDDLADIEARAEAATEGPWVVTMTRDRRWHQVRSPRWDEEEGASAQAVALCGDDRPAEFIAKARTDVPRLVRALREAREEASWLRAERFHWMETSDRLRAQVEKVRALADEWEREDPDDWQAIHISAKSAIRAASHSIAHDIRTALDAS